MLNDFTTCDEIRAVLGVSDEEIEDSTLLLPMYSTVLELALAEVNTDLEVLYLAAKASATPSDGEKKLVDVVSVFSAYAIANHLLTSMPLFAPQRITDGRAEVGRVSDPFEGVREGVTSYLQLLKGRLNKLLELLGQTVTPGIVRTYIGISKLAVNPVTNT